MNLKLIFKAIAIYIKKNILENGRYFAKSYVSLFLVATTLAAATFAWFTIQDNAEVTSSALKLESSSSLNVSEEQTISNHITIDSVKLDEAGSIDGRNVYFPTTGSAAKDGSSLTEPEISDLLFREATVGDQNVRYIYKNFTLYGNSDQTDVYIKSYAITVKYANDVTVKVPGKNTRVLEEKYNGSTEIQIDNNGTPSDIERLNKCPIRVAFISDSQNDPVILDPSAMVEAYAQKFTTVAHTKSDGSAIVKNSVAKAFSDYYHLTGQPVFSIVGKTPLNGTMVAWLEGASERSDDLRNATISIDIELESVFPKKDIITFIDNTWGDSGSTSHWIIDQAHPCIITMTYKDGTDHSGQDNIKTVVMQKYASKVTLSNGDQCDAWWAPIPETVVTDITFNRYDLTSETIFNAWYTNDKVQDSNFLGEHINGLLNKTSGNASIKLEKTREYTEGGVKKRYLTYTALRGNGYSKTEDTKQRLSPCVGYWYTDLHTGQAGSSSGGGSTGGDTSGSTAAYNIYLNLTDTHKGWISQHISDISYTMYVIFGDNSQVAMTWDGSNNDRLKCSGTKDKGTTIKGFALKNIYGDIKNITVSGGAIPMVQASASYTFELQSDWKYASRTS